MSRFARDSIIHVTESENNNAFVPFVSFVFTPGTFLRASVV
jgi:hypothetical protein